MKASLTLKCYKNKENLPYLAHIFDIYGNPKYNLLYDVYDQENGTILWNFTNKNKEFCMLFKKDILNRIKILIKGVKKKIKKDENEGRINNIPLFGKEKTDAFSFISNVPKFRIYYREINNMKKYYVIYQPFGLGEGKQVSFYSRTLIDGNTLEVWSAGIINAHFFEDKNEAELKYNEYKDYLPVILKELEFDCDV